MIDDWTHGYLDGRDRTSPAPSNNRSAAYCHSWRVGRREIEGRPLRAAEARRRAAEAAAAEAQRMAGGR